MNQYITNSSPVNNVISNISNTSSASFNHVTINDSSPLAHRVVNGINLPETIRQIEQQIALFGPGPHTPSQKVELNKLLVYLQRAKIDLQKQQQQQQTMSSKLSASPSSTPSTPVSTMTSPSPVQNKPPPSTASSSATNGPASSERRVLDRRRLQELVKEVDPMEQLEEDVEEVLLQIADDFIEGVVTNSCHLARHRKSNTLEAKDVKLHLEHCWNMVIPGYGTDDVRTYKKACTTEAHKQRMSLIRKTLKKY